MGFRLFVAVEIDEAVRALAVRAARALAESGVVGRFESPEKLHVTVAFLGSLPEEQVPAVVETLHEAAAACRPFDLEFARLGAFPNERRPRVFWIGPQAASEAFDACARRVRDGYKRLDLTFDNDARAHVTICRPKFVPADLRMTSPGRARMHALGLTLFRSLPAGQTTRYEALARTRFPDEGAAGDTSGRLRR